MVQITNRFCRYDTFHNTESESVLPNNGTRQDKNDAEDRGRGREKLNNGDDNRILSSIK